MFRRVTLLVRPKAIACGADLSFTPDVFFYLLVRSKTIVFGRTSVLLCFFSFVFAA